MREAAASQAATASKSRIALGLGIGPQRRGKPRQPLGQLGDQADQLARVAAETAGQLAGAGVVHEMAQRLHERLVGHAEVLVASARQMGIVGDSAAFGSGPRCLTSWQEGQRAMRRTRRWTRRVSS